MMMNLIYIVIYINLVWITGSYGEVTDNKNYNVVLSPLGCSDGNTCNDPRQVRIKSQLLNNVTLTIDHQIEVVKFNKDCTPITPNKSDEFVAFMNCDYDCRPDTRYHNVKGLFFYHPELPCNSKLLLSNSYTIPVLLVDKETEIPDINFTASINDNQRQEFSWVGIQIAMGVVSGILILTLIVVWWKKPWRRGNSFATPMGNNLVHPAKLEKSRLEVFSTVNYRPKSNRNSFPLQELSNPVQLKLQKARFSLPANTKLSYFRDNSCAICLGEYELDDRLRILTCRHAFHADCIDPWLLNPDFKNVCPTCKSDLSIPLGLPPSSTSTNSPGPIVRFEEILGIAVPVLIYPEDIDFISR